MPFSKRKEAPSACPKTGKSLGRFRKYPWLIWLFPITGLLSLIWFLIRVVPKPSRATYPCQRVAMPLAGGFIVWLTGLIGSALAYHKAKRLLHQSRYVLAGICAAVAVMAIWWSLSVTGVIPAKAAFTPTDPPNTPMGVAKGIHPGRVVWVHEPNATNWDGFTGYWWNDNNTNQKIVDAIVARAIRMLTGEWNDENAWDALFRYFNQAKGKGDVGYQAPEKIVIKINMNNNNGSDNQIDASPHMVLGILRQLVNQAGIAQSAITVYDAQKIIGAAVYNHCHPEFPYVGYNANIGWVPYAITYSAEVTNYNARRLPQCVLDAEYMINMPILKRHDGQAAVTLCAKNHFGTIGSPSALHTYIRCWERGMGAYDPLVDIMGHKDIGGKTILYIIDGLYGGDSWGATPRRWASAPFNGDWPSSIFVSQDPVAIDSVGLDFLRAEWLLRNNADNYLHEAALAHNPASGTFYDPENDGTRLASLGVHEHWNNPTDKQYSRNLGTGNGIELWQRLLAPDVDLSGDGKVNFKDFSILAQYWSEDEPSVDLAPPPFGDGMVDFNDLAVLTENWLTATTIPPLPGQVSNPNPTNDATGVDPNTDLSWTAGADATSHDVYFGTSTSPPFIGNQTATTFEPGTMAHSSTYYWCIDAVNGWGKTTGTVWSFTTTTGPQASNPNPANGATWVNRDADLSWTAGAGAESHNVYFGTSSPGTFQGNQPDAIFDPGTMPYSTKYYWRIDEVGAYGTITGIVWNFTTVLPPPPPPQVVYYNPMPIQRAKTRAMSRDMR